MNGIYSVIRAAALLLGVGFSAHAGLITYDFDIDFTEAQKGTLAGQFYEGSFTIDDTPDRKDEGEDEYDLDENALLSFSIKEIDLLDIASKTDIDLEFEDGLHDFDDSEFKLKLSKPFFLKELKFECYEVTAKPQSGQKTEGFIRFRPRRVPDTGASTFLLISVFAGLACVASQRKGNPQITANKTNNKTV